MKNEKDKDSDKESNNPFMDVRYLIPSIDNNTALRKFITKQNEKKKLYASQTQKDIKQFIDKIIEVKKNSKIVENGKLPTDNSMNMIFNNMPGKSLN